MSSTVIVYLIFILLILVILIFACASPTQLRIISEIQPHQIVTPETLFLKHPCLLCDQYFIILGMKDGVKRRSECDCVERAGGTPSCNILMCSVACH